MVYVFPLLLALIVSACAEFGLSTGWMAPYAWLPLLAGPPLLIRAATVLRASGRPRLSSLADSLLTWLPWLGQGVAVCVFGFGLWLGGLGVDAQILEEWPGFGVLLLLVPYFSLELAVLEARTRNFGVGESKRRALRNFQLRQLASSSGQLVLILLFTLPIREFRTLRVVLEEVAAAEALWIIGLLTAFGLFLPGFLRFAWNTTPMPAGDSRRVLDGLADRASFRYRELLLWRTGHLVANAAIVGFGPRGRVILFSDALLARLAPRELAAVFGHEMGHSLRRHVFAFVAWTLGLVLATDWLSVELDRNLEDATLWIGGLTLCVPVVWYLVFGWASRRFELDADLVSVELTGDAEALAVALEKVSGGVGRERDSWRHFSTAKRVRFLQSLTRDPEVGRDLRRRLGVFVAASFALLAFGVILKAHSIVTVFPEDRVLVELRLGRYEAVSQHVAEAGLDSEYAELARVGAELSEQGFTDPAAWLELADTARERGEELRADRIEELAGLRGEFRP